MFSDLKADLHMHSFYSDGALSPSELIGRALDSDTHVVALTDHDTISGVADMQKAALQTGIRVITGVEISVRWKKHDIHVVGLNMDIAQEGLVQLLASQAQRRQERAHRIAKALESIGLNDAYSKACNIAGHENVTRPHFAQVLVNEGLVKTVQSAFQQYLKRGRVAFVPTEWASIEEAVNVINAAGGNAVLAHPLKYKLTPTKLNALIQVFKEAGGEAIEVVSGASTPTDVRKLAALCHRYDMLGSTGSDYHSDKHSFTGVGKQRSLPDTVQPIWLKWAAISKDKAQ